MAENIERALIPEPIAKAIVEVMAAVGPLKKEETNKFDNYEYAGIDAFINHVRKHMAEAGLFIVTDEAAEPRLESMQTKDGKPLMMWWARFAFTLCHESGAVHGPIHKAVMVQAKGAQAAGAAQSYALKQLMRALFLIPTGDDDDPDKTSAEIQAAGESGTDYKKEGTRIKKAIERAKNSDSLQEVWAMNEPMMDEISEVSAQMHTYLCDLYAKKEEDLK